MSAINPEVIISLGNTPTKALLNIKKPITQVRGEFYDYNGMKLIPTFNPAYILRDPSKKREVWEDMKMVRDFLTGRAKDTPDETSALLLYRNNPENRRAVL